MYVKRLVRSIEYANLFSLLALIIGITSNELGVFHTLIFYSALFITLLVLLPETYIMLPLYVIVSFVLFLMSFDLYNLFTVIAVTIILSASIFAYRFVVKEHVTANIFIYDFLEKLVEKKDK